MSVVTVPNTHVLRPGLLQLAVLVGGCVNGFAVQIIGALQNQGIESAPFFGISPFALITIGIAATLMAGSKADAHESGFSWIDGLAVAIILLPSGSLSWSVVALYGVHVGLRGNAGQRAGAYLFTGLALAVLWTSIVAKWFAMAFTTLDASLLRAVLSLWQDRVEQVDNIVSHGGGYGIVVILTCATAYALPGALVYLAAMAHGRGAVNYARLSRNLALFAAVFVAANIARLALMASSEAMYDIVHGPIGANLFDGFQIVSMLVLSAGVDRA